MGAFEILPEQMQWMGEFGLRKKNTTEYLRTEGQPAAFGNDAAGCFFVMAFNWFSFVRPAGAAALSSVPRSLKSRADRQGRHTVRRVRSVRRSAGQPAPVPPLAGP